MQDFYYYVGDIVVRISGISTKSTFEDEWQSRLCSILQEEVNSQIRKYKEKEVSE